MKTPKGIAALPVLAIIGAVVALAVGWFLYQTTAEITRTVGETNTAINRNVAVNTNTSLDVNTAVNTNVATNTNTSAAATSGWKTYTNTKQGFSIRVPDTWVHRSEMDGSPIPITDGDEAMTNFSEPGTAAVHHLTVQIEDRTVGTIVHTGTIAYWKMTSTIAKEESTKINGITFLKIMPANGTEVYYLLEHGTHFYIIAQWGGEDKEASDIIDTFALLQPDEKLVDIGTALPFKSVSNIRSLFGITNMSSPAVVSVMGDRALIGGWEGRLFLYNGSTATDMSEKLKPARSDLDPKNTTVRGIGNNGKYWLVSSSISGESDRLFKYDGNTWTELSDAFHAATLDIGLGGAQSLIWNGKYWLIGDNLGRLVRFDGNKFTDLTSLLFPDKKYEIVNDIAWNGKYFLISTGSNISTIYKYSGATITALTGFGENNTIQQIGWNGSYWLLGALELPYYLQKYDGTTATPLTVEGAGDVMDMAWVKPFWIVNNRLFDGTKFDTFSPLNGLSDRVSISVGTHLGIIVDNRGDVVRFDY